MAKMTKDEREQYLAGVHVGVIAVERPGRAPLAVPLWHDYRPGGEVLLWTDTDSVKHKLIRDAGRFAITVQDEQPPYKYVSAEGDVTDIGPAQDAEVRALAVRYLGEQAGGQFAGENLTSTSIVIRMRPQHWLSTDYSK
ncbi:pyridoxamine 5'-phosphate oxidase family protein [Mycobacterium sp. ITM-2016-00317]|uniref:pyridoxamine 5'-phosphate oxidase family protein n=1 Tax=Mycobacterium sp. ITM-2016-00317 TaxID=2099694 RepID=UPI00287FAB38|nr:pyridoxamine 5'-phosphate oxidase family protein [Mycobacterium sp. ITM-2016-00317]WNG88592.1 pyridoxamine 5'-phosphate oxidase family protein [Mycobacterium sp. ITM-2016-00317]